MSKSSQYAATFMDTVFIIVALALVGLLGWNTVRIGDIEAGIDRNRAHSCWIMEAMFGPPESGNRTEACEELRDHAEERWEEAQ